MGKWAKNPQTLENQGIQPAHFHFKSGQKWPKVDKKIVYTKNIESFLQVTIFPKNKCIYKLKWPKMAKNGQKICIYKNKMAPNGLKKCIYKNKNGTKWSHKMYIQNISIARLLPRILVYQPRSKDFCPTFTRFPAYKLEHFFLFRRDSQHKILCFFTSNTWSASHIFHCISPPK